MLTSELQYELPPELIAQQPAKQRDTSRLLVVDRASSHLRHEVSKNLPDLLPGGSLLVLNDTRVLPAQLRMHRRSGGQVSGLFLQEPQPGVWEVMLTGSRRLKTGEELLIDGSKRKLRLLQRLEKGNWRAEPVPTEPAETILSQVGHAPLPPYIRRDETVLDPQFRQRFGLPGENSDPPLDTNPDVPAGQDARDMDRYQTIYARRPGAIAAPTAGLHLTEEVFDRLRANGISIEFVTLHVGVGTFTPVRCADLADHQMHAEWYECPSTTAAAINSARTEGRAIVGVGTTSVRVLETCADQRGQVTAGSGWTRLFIYPPYQFSVVDKLLTNFHLPGSTLLAMVFALGGRERILAAYREAIDRQYRFYSYGDAMLIL